MTSPLGFKARVGSALFELCGGVCYKHSLRFTSGVTPLPVYNASIAASHLPHMRVSAEVGCRDLNHRPPARQSDALPTRPQQPAWEAGLVWCLPVLHPLCVDILSWILFVHLPLVQPSSLLPGMTLSIDCFFKVLFW